MSARLTVIFFIILCLEAGLALTILPWAGWWLGLGDWGDNYLLVYAAQKTGLGGLQSAISSGWMRGAVTGLGLLNLLMAFWEMAHFNQTVRALNAHEAAATAAAASSSARATTDAAEEAHADRAEDPARLSHHAGRDNARDDS
jgi:hypothetical protein